MSDQTTTSLPTYLASAFSMPSESADRVAASEQFPPQLRRLTTGTRSTLGQEPGPGQDLLVLYPGFAQVGPMGASAAIPPVVRHGRP